MSISQNATLGLYFDTCFKKIPFEEDHYSDYIFLSPTQGGSFKKNKFLGNLWYLLYQPTNFLKNTGLADNKQIKSKKGKICLDLIYIHTSPEGAIPFKEYQLIRVGDKLPIINYSLTSCVNIVKNNWTESYNLGVRVFRIDAAAYIDPNVLSKLIPDKALKNKDFTIILEYYGSNSEIMKYIKTILKNIGNQYDNNIKAYDFILSLNFYNSLIHDDLNTALQEFEALPYKNSVLPVDNHDSFSWSNNVIQSPAYCFFVRTFCLTAFNIPVYNIITNYQISNNLVFRDVFNLESLNDIIILKEERKNLYGLSFFTLHDIIDVKTGKDISRYTFCFQRGKSFLQVITTYQDSSFQETISIKHYLKPGWYKNLTSQDNQLILITEDRLIMPNPINRCVALKALEHETVISIPKNVFVIWVQGFENLENNLDYRQSWVDQKFNMYSYSYDTFVKFILPKTKSSWVNFFYEFKEYLDKTRHCFSNDRYYYMCLSDIMRIYIVYLYGGYYADLDTELYNNFDIEFSGYELIIAYQQDRQINNAFYGSTKESKYLEDLMNVIILRFMKYKNCCLKKPFIICGPPAWTEAFKDVFDPYVLTITKPQLIDFRFKKEPFYYEARVIHYYDSITDYSDYYYTEKESSNLFLVLVVVILVLIFIIIYLVVYKNNFFLRENEEKFQIGLDGNRS